MKPNFLFVVLIFFAFTLLSCSKEPLASSQKKEDPCAILQHQILSWENSNRDSDLVKSKVNALRLKSSALHCHQN